MKKFMKKHKQAFGAAVAILLAVIMVLSVLAPIAFSLF